MKYKVLKECVIEHKFYKKGETYERKRKAGDVTFIRTLIKHGFIEKIPKKPKTVWDLKHGDECWLLNCGCYNEVTVCAAHYGSCYESDRSIGDLFLTKADAERELARRKAKVILERDTKGFKPKHYNNYAHFEAYYTRSGKLETNSDFGLDDNLHFATEEDAQESIRKHEQEWKIYLGVEE